MTAFDLLGWTEQRERTFLDRYARRTVQGELMESTPREMWIRLAATLGRDDEEIRQFLGALEDWRFVPGGRILSGVGTDQMSTLYNCFVIGVDTPGKRKGRDSRSAIMHTTGRMVEITSRGGGVGVNWSILRPRDSYIRGVNGRSTGAVAWASAADGMVDKIQQGGSRTAALMYILNDWHPDLREFVQHMFLRANHSVAVSEKFMYAVQDDLDWELEFPDTSHPDYDQEWNGDLLAWKAEGRPVIVHETVPARELWKLMQKAVRDTGNPGLVFIDLAQEASNTGYFEQYVATNPCGEQFLPENGCCNLGAINLTAHWDAEKQALDYERLTQTVTTAVRFLDRVIDVSPDIDPDIGNLQRRVRRVGLGAMGLADVLVLAGLSYASEEGRGYAGHVYEVIRDAAYSASVDLAEEFGPAPAYTPDFLDRPFVRRLPLAIKRRIEEYGIRNLTLTNQAPTGTTSVVAGASSGIEPIFAESYVRKDATGTTTVRHPLFPESEQERGPQHVTAMKGVPVSDHILMQAVVQRFLDNAISKTINLPADSTLEDIDSAYWEAWDNLVKGVTVYVDGSRGTGVLQPDNGERQPGRLECGDDCALPGQHDHDHEETPVSPV